MGLRNQRVKIRQRSVFRIDVAIIRHVITKILLWRRKERADPDGVNAQIGDIIQSGDDPLQVADTIAVGILKRPWIDLIDDGRFPPFQI